MSLDHSLARSGDDEVSSADLDRLLRGLEERAARLDAATAALVRAEVRVDDAARDVAGPLRGVADVAGVPVPVMVPPAARRSRRLHPAVVEAEHIVRARALELEAQRRRADRWSAAIEPGVVGLLGTLLAFAVGTVSALGAGRLPGDAVSRLAAAQTMVAGRDPHPESIGFIWGPFPTMFEVPFAWFRHMWLGWTASGIAAVAVSSICLGVMLAQVVRWGRDGGAPRWMRLSVALLLVAHPLVLLYGGNGMSECCWLMFLVAATRFVSKWWESDDVVALAAGGVMVGLAYLTRYESVATVAAVATLVALVSWRRVPTNGAELSLKDRAWGTSVELSVFLFPPAAAFLGWAFASWAVVGQPFAQFTSQYGNSALVAASQAGNSAAVTDMTAATRMWFYVTQVMVAAPLLVPVVLLALWVGGRTARRTVAAVAVLGAPLALQCLFAVQGQTFNWFRYVVTAVVLVGLAALSVGGSSTWIRDRRWVRPVVVLALMPGVLLSWTSIWRHDTGTLDDARTVDGIVAAVRHDRIDRGSSTLWLAQRVGRDINKLGGAVPGSVLTDVSSTDTVVATAPRPEVFVIPADRDFLPIVADPALFGVRYILLRTPATPGDAVVRAYPGLLTDKRHPVAKFVRSWGREGDRTGQYRLYVVRHPRGAPRPRPAQGFEG